MVFGLLYKWVHFYGGTKILGLDAELSIGDGERPFLPGTTGYLDFDASNSPDFAAFATLLTNGLAKELSTANLVLLKDGEMNGEPFAGGVGTGPQTSVAALAGARIDFIRLVVDSVEANVGGGAYSYNTQARWQFWGSPAPFLGTCTYPLKFGAGSSLIHFCLSGEGTVLKLEGPAGQEHIANGQVWEGYIVCSGTTVQAWDMSGTSLGFGATTVLKGPTATAVTLRRSSEQYQLDQAFALDRTKKELTITMTLTNISGAPIPDVRLARSYDPDPNNDAGVDSELKAARSVVARDVDLVSLSGITWNFSVDTAISTASVQACSPDSGSGPTSTGDGRLANVTYRLGNMTPGGKKKVAFVYRVQ